MKTPWWIWAIHISFLTFIVGAVVVDSVFARGGVVGLVISAGLGLGLGIQIGRVVEEIRRERARRMKERWLLKHTGNGR